MPPLALDSFDWINYAGLTGAWTSAPTVPCSDFEDFGLGSEPESEKVEKGVGVGCYVSVMA